MVGGLRLGPAGHSILLAARHRIGKARSAVRISASGARHPGPLRPRRPQLRGRRQALRLARTVGLRRHPRPPRGRCPGRPPSLLRGRL